MKERCTDPNCLIHGRHGLSSLLKSLTGSGGFPDDTGIPILTGDMTLMGIAEDGTVQRIRTGTTTKTVPFSEITDLHADVMPAFEAYQTVANDIEQKREEASKLRTEAGDLETDINRRVVDLRFEISDLLPASNENWFGDLGLTLMEDGDEGGILVNTCDDTDGAVALPKESAQPLLERQAALKADKDRLAQMKKEAAVLERQVRKLPDLLEQRKLTVGSVFSLHVVPKFQDDPQNLSVAAGFDPDGNPEVVIFQRIDESGDELTPEELALMTAALKLDMSRGNVGEIPEPVRQLLKLDEPTAEITSDAGDTDNADQSTVRSDESEPASVQS